MVDALAHDAYHSQSIGASRGGGADWPSGDRQASAVGGGRARRQQGRWGTTVCGGADQDHPRIRLPA